MKKFIGIAVAVILVGIILVSSIHIVPTGYTGIRIRFGQVNSTPIHSGQVFFTMPFFEDIVTVNNKQRDFLFSSKIWGETDDRTPVYAQDVYVTLQVSPERSVWLYSNVNDIEKNLVSATLVASAVKAAMVELSPSDVTNRAMIEPLVKDKLTEALNEKYGEETIVVTTVKISDMDFEAEYNNAIQQKSIATQNASRIEIENNTALAKAEADKKIAVLQAEAESEKVRIAAEAEAERAKIAAGAAAETVKIAAEAEAERVRVVAEAEAEANKMIEETLTEALVELKKIESWDGKLPIMVGSNDTILDVSDIIESNVEK